MVQTSYLNPFGDEVRRRWVNIARLDELGEMDVLDFHVLLQHSEFPHQDLVLERGLLVDLMDGRLESTVDVVSFLLHLKSPQNLYVKSQLFRTMCHSSLHHIPELSRNLANCDIGISRI